MNNKLKPCPFCGGSAQAKVMKDPLKRLVLLVDHDKSCFIGTQRITTLCYLDFDVESEVGKEVLDIIINNTLAIKNWNKRAEQ